MGRAALESVQFYPLITATNKVESWSWLLIYRFNKDGKMVENRWYWDGFPLSG
jgi:hypothetical protein